MSICIIPGNVFCAEDPGKYRNTLEILRVWFQTTIKKMSIAIKLVIIFLLVEVLAFNLSKNATSTNCSKVKCNKTRYAYRESSFSLLLHPVEETDT